MQNTQTEIGELGDLRPLSDSELIALTRAGQNAAFAVLWERHFEAGMTSARYHASDLPSQDLVAEAYVRIFSALSAGKGPNSAFRTYLQMTIRNLSVTWRKQGQKLIPLDSVDAEELVEDTPFDFDHNEDRKHIADAFQSLPETWQEVLWLREVLDVGTKEVASRLEITPNAAAALTFRAKEGLRQAWIARQIKTKHLSEDCKLNVERLPGYVRESLGARDRAKTEKHLSECATCPEILASTRQLTSRLHIILVPATLAATGSLLFEANSDSAGASTGAANAVQVGARGASTKLLHSKGLFLLGIGAVIAGILIAPNFASVNAQGVAEPKNVERATEQQPTTAPTADPEPTVSDEILDDAQRIGRTNDPVRSALYSLPAVDARSTPVFAIQDGTVMSGSEVLLSGFAAAGASVELTMTSDQGTPRIHKAQALSNGAWYTTLTSLSPGNYSATATQQASGEPRSSSAAISFSVASSDAMSAPQVSQIDTADSRYLPVVRGTATPGSAIIVWINGVGNESITNADGTWTVYPDRGGIEGSNVVSIQAADSGSKRLSPPTAESSFVLVAPGIELDQNGSSPTVTATTLPASFVVVTDKDSFANLIEAPDGTGTFTISPDIASQPLRDGVAVTAIYTNADGKRVGAPARTVR